MLEIGRAAVTAVGAFQANFAPVVAVAVVVAADAGEVPTAGVVVDACAFIIGIGTGGMDFGGIGFGGTADC